MAFIKERMENNILHAYEKLRSRLYDEIGKLTVEAYITKEPVSHADRKSGRFVSLKEGDAWGELWDCAWFHITGTVPDTGSKPAALCVDVGGECLIVDENGNPLQGLTHVEQEFDRGMGVPGKRIFRLPPDMQPGSAVDFWMDVGCNGLLGEGNLVSPEQQIHGRVKRAVTIAVNEEIRTLFYDFQVLIDLMHNLSRESARYNSLFFTLHDAANKLKYLTADEIKEASDMVAKELNKKGGDASLRFNAIGHSHIDLAWLWPIRETKRKGGRTFSNVLSLMDRYEDFVFGASQPQLFQWVKEDYPDVYRRVKQRVDQGRWEIQGAMWVEPDTNVPSGESLVRQLLYGKRFFKEEFGKEVRNLWLPDVFGYSGALPQILKKAGVDYFMTTKLAFNEHTRFQHHTFFWEGIDGTRILSHMLPEGNYNGPMTPWSVLHAERSHFENGRCDEALMLFGVGDGGGGPGAEHLERAHRMKDLNGLCPVSQGFAQDMFDRIAENSQKYDIYKGELYFERHQGTYTTQCKNKWYNRHIEFKLHDLEFLTALTGDRFGIKKELDDIWKEILLYQFHDILPGSSINRVYDESLEAYERIYRRLDQMILQTCKAVAGEKLVVNSLSWDRWDWLETENGPVKVLAKALSAASLQCVGHDLSPLKAEGNCIENEYLAVIFNDDGSIASVYDKMNRRETLKDGFAGNRLAVWEDRGDCWDIYIEYLYTEPEYFALEKQTLRIEGASAVMEQEYVYGASVIKQKVCLVAGKPYVDFQTTVDWREDRKMLRTSFDVDVIADAASFEIQFGLLRRPVSENNIYETAKFEQCGHKWADLSQSDYGVALLNDCKYGYRVKGQTLDLNLLRAQNFPGEGSDRGIHHFKYALFPHNDAVGVSDVVRVGFEYNVPLWSADGAGDSGICGDSVVSLDGRIILDTVKNAEDGKGVILRFYEPYGSSGTAEIILRDLFTQATLCDLIENETEKIEFDGRRFSLNYKPFEIISVKLV